MNKEFHVVFSGKTIADAEPALVARKIASAIKADDSHADTLLNGEPHVIKRLKNINQAKQVVSRLEKIGAHAEIIQIDHTNEIIPPLSDINDASQRDDGQSPNSTACSLGSLESEVEELTITLKNKLQYKLDTFMAKGSGSSFKALLFAFVGLFLVFAGARALLFSLSPDLQQQYTELDVWGNIYLTFLQLTDPGNMAQDILSSPGYKVVAVLAGLFGVIMLSAVIAVITTALTEKLDALKRGRSKVVEDEHTLIIGWDEQRIVEIIRELIFANESEKNPSVVILADMDKQYMDDQLRLRIPDSENTRIITRSGKGSILVNLDMVSVESAKSVIVLASCKDSDSLAQKSASDAMVIQTTLALTTKSVRKEEYAIVAEVFNETYRDIIQHTFPDFVVTLDTSNILAKLLVQTSRSVGLSVVYSEILSFDGCEMYFYDDTWNGALFVDLAYHFPDGVPIGVRHENGELSINPAVDYRMQDSDEILIVADDDSTIEYLPTPLIVPETYQPLGHKAEPRIERELILGWNHKIEMIISEFADYVEQGSEIDIVIHNPDYQIDVINRINRELDNMTIRLVDINQLDRNQLLGIEPFKYDNIIILAGADNAKDTQQVDSENIVTLLLLRSIFEEYQGQAKDTKLITEVLESQNNALIAKAGVKDMIISNRLVSMITAQISESKGIKDVYDDLFQEDGSEIYLKPLSLYFDDFPVTVRFADLISVAKSRDEVCFGVKIKAEEENKDKNNGVQLIPLKDKVFTLNREDSLVVVAEDEF